MLRFIPGQVSSTFTFIDPDTGYKFSGRSKLELIHHIRNYRAQNGLEAIDYLDMAVEDYLCRLPENVGKSEVVPLRRGWFEWSTGAFNVVKQVFLGEKNMVTDEVAEKRAAVCVECPHNVFPDKGPFIEFADRLAENMTYGRRTSLHDKLGSCEKCSCTTKAKVFCKGPFKLKEEWKDSMKRVGCWQLDEEK